MLDALHPSLRGAIAAGWEGLTLVEDERDGALVLVCSTPSARETARRGPCLGVRRAPAPRGGGLIVLSVGVGPDGATLELGIDLAYEGGRALARRLGDEGAMRVLLVGPREGDGPVDARVAFREEARSMLLRAVASAGEWRVEDPPPDGPPASGPLPRLAATPSAPGVALHVPFERLPGLTAAGGIGIALGSGRHAPPLLLVSARGAGAQDPLRLRLECRHERALAARAARSGRLRVVGVVPGDECFRAWGDAELGDEACRALRRAALVAPEDGGPGAAP